MTYQSGHDYRSEHKHASATEQMSEAADQITDKAQKLGSEALDRADEFLKPVGLSIREQPMTCLAIVGGVAFAVGAFWMLRSSQNHSRTEDLARQFSEFAGRFRGGR